MSFHHPHSQYWCYCGKVSTVHCSWTDENAGRRFYGCYKGRGPGHCNFFIWLDPKMCPRSLQIIPGLIRNKNKIERELKLTQEKQRRLWAIVVVSSILLNRANKALKLNQANKKELEVEMKALRATEKKLWAVIILMFSFFVYAIMIAG
ncbi:hypothetical protein M0R45_035947 [Rubus argutus]|uniref:GRF-type domain-containing protein n=1 Tax=Rubus argutus TaxID=59490 RepID=A0AAW1VYB7_RUBAR